MGCGAHDTHTYSAVDDVDVMLLAAVLCWLLPMKIIQNIVKVKVRSLFVAPLLLLVAA